MKSSTVTAFSLGLAVVAFAFVVWLVWINRGGDRVPMLFWKAVCAPLAATIFLLGYDLAKPLEEQRVTVPLTLYRAGDNLFANRDLAKDDQLPALPYGYVWIDACYRAWQPLNPKRSDISSEAQRWETQYKFYQEAAEAAVVMWLASRYSRHWQIEDRMLEGFEGSLGSIGELTPNAEPIPKKVTVTEVAKLTGSDLIRDIGLQQIETIYFPAGAKVSAGAGDRAGRRLSIETPVTVLDISIWCMNLPNEIRSESHNPLMRRMAKAFGTEDVNGTYVYVEFHSIPKRWRRWSGRTEQEGKWISAMMDRFKKDFEWRAPVATTRG